MKRYILFIILLQVFVCKGQIYTRGGASQLYWDWRPDIASNCYEFTFVNYVKVNLLPPHYDYKIEIWYWDDCNYGKSFVMDSNCSIIHQPLRDTLYRVTSFYGERDTLCGFDSPYDPGTNLNFAQKTSPVRTKIIYKGLVYLPEKCNRWYFSVAKSFPTNGIDQYYLTNGNTAGDGTYTNFRSNIDSMLYYMWSGNLISYFSYLRMPVTCSFDNTNFSNNSSNRFLSQPAYYFPVGKEINYNFGNYDPDHDSLLISIPDTIKSAEYLTSIATFEIFCVHDAAGNPVNDILTHNFFFASLPGASGINPSRYNAQNNPFGTDSTFYLVDSTGKMTFTAQSDMEPILYTKATEYRNGKFLSETFIINQFTLINENREPSFMRIDTATVQNALFNSQGTMMSCTGLPISFDAYVKLPIAGGYLIVRTTADTTLPGNGACTITGVHTDSVHLKFTWTPPASARGLYNVYVSAKDTNCSAPFNHYLQVFTLSFYIDSCLSPLNLSPNLASNGEDNIVIYPNPATGKVTITSSKEFRSIKVYNLVSELVMEEKTRPSRQLELDVSSLSPGMYMVNVDGVVRKMVVGD